MRRENTYKDLNKESMSIEGFRVRLINILENDFVGHVEWYKTTHRWNTGRKFDEWMQHLTSTLKRWENGKYHR